MGDTPQGSDIIKGWPEESQEAAQLVIDTYGEPQEATESLLTWHQVGPRGSGSWPPRCSSSISSRPPTSTRWSRCSTTGCRPSSSPRWPSSTAA